MATLHVVLNSSPKVLVWLSIFVQSFARVFAILYHLVDPAYVTVGKYLHMQIHKHIYTHAQTHTYTVNVVDNVLINTCRYIMVYNKAIDNSIHCVKLL